MTSINQLARWTRLVLGTAALGAVMSACTPLVVGGGMLTGAMVAADRRTSGAQLDDQGIELRAANRLSDTFGGRARVSVTSYNRRVLLTGEVANERDRQLAEDTVKKIDNVNLVYNELGITNSPSFSEKAADTLLTGRVKAGLVDTKKLSANSFKVVSERSTVYLMGRVTQREADQATEVARTTKGAQRVVRVFEILSEEELARMATQ